MPERARSRAGKDFGDDALLSGGFEASEGWGFAVDVGTTTVAGALVDLATGRVEASTSTANLQARHGADVMSRIAFSASTPGGTGVLHREVVETVDGVLRECGRRAGVDPGTARRLTFVGNPTMMHALLGLDLRGLGEAPFRGEREGPWEGEARELDLEVPGGRAHVLPGVGGHVGSDTVGAILAAGLDAVEAPTLLVDLGTNSEVVVATPESLLCASTAAGPAFEGATVRHGMRAAEGAVERVELDGSGDLAVSTVGGGPAVGICGSGVVDAVAVLLRTGVLEPSGRIRTPEELRGVVPGPLARRVGRGGEAGRHVRIAGEGRREIRLEARDVREVQLVKASIAAGIVVLLREAGVGADEVRDVLLAGAFGSRTRGESVRALGLVPRLPGATLRPVGDAAAAGARLALVDPGARERARAIRRSARLVDLAGRAAYREAFVEAMTFPAPAGEAA